MSMFASVSRRCHPSCWSRPRQRRRTGPARWRTGPRSVTRACHQDTKSWCLDRPHWPMTCMIYQLQPHCWPCSCLHGAVRPMPHRPQSALLDSLQLLRTTATGLTQLLLLSLLSVLLPPSPFHPSLVPAPRPALLASRSRGPAWCSARKRGSRPAAPWGRASSPSLSCPARAACSSSSSSSCCCGCCCSIPGPPGLLRKQRL